MKRHYLKVTFTKTELGVLRKALEFKQKPDGWRVAEYVVTKTCFHETIERIKVGEEIEIELFDLGVLTGELARHYKWGGEHHGTLLLFSRLYDLKQSVPELRIREKKERAVHAALDAADKLDRRAKKLRDAANRDMALVRSK